MTGDPWTDRLSEYIDGDLPPAEREALEGHLDRCEACAETVAQLRAVVRRAGEVTDRAPDADLWDGIAARIGASPARVAGRAGRRRPLRISLGIPQLLAAGIALAVVSGGGVWVVTRGEPAPGSALGPSTAPAVAVPVVATPATPGGRRYDEAIADLVVVLEAQRDALDPETVRVVEHSLAVIDRALEQARLALLADPESEYLRDHLDRIKQRKLALLRRVTDVASAT